jgi:medium-chain acyl-[acyl-carrier-protein] hydrolase
VRNPWFPLCVPLADSRLRLFCLPFAGGGASAYRLWPRYLPDDIEVRAVQPPGRENRIRETPLKCVADLVAELLPVVTPLLDRPYALFGHSLGSHVAFELSRELVARGRPRPVRLFASGSSAPHLPQKPPLRAHLPEGEFEKEVLGLGGTPPEVLEHPELMEVLMPMLRADFHMSESYISPASARIPCPLSIYSGADDSECEPERSAAWAELADGEVRERVFEGGHFFLQSATEEVCSAVVEELAP